MFKEAAFYKRLEKNIVQCLLCSRQCTISENKTGVCGVRKNIKGKLYSLVYGKLCSVAVDPIEKKPLFHFAPGSQTLSIATVGCNLGCIYCQNWGISHPPEREISGEEIAPEEVVEMVNERKLPGISYTYTEPTIMWEFAYDTMKLAKKQKLYNIWVSNGYTTTEAIEKAKDLIDAVNIDYKGDEDLYRSLCSAHLEPVQNALKTYKRLGIWIEITNLLIPGHNDKDEQIKEMVQWIVDNLGQVPLHFSRFFPYHKLHADITDIKSLERASGIAEKSLDYVYVGNVRHEKENTYCHNCKELLIERSGFSAVKLNLTEKGRDFVCPACSKKIPLAGMQWAKKSGI